MLAPGTYWLAAIAGPLADATQGPSWNVSTPSSIVLASGGVGVTSVTLSVCGWNTTWPTPAPRNNDCQNALLVVKDQCNTASWLGSNIGATQDGPSNCYIPLANSTYKDGWFRLLCRKPHPHLVMARILVHADTL
jgi:hypothetical protein